jgi:hypothetical protein
MAAMLSASLPLSPIRAGNLPGAGPAAWLVVREQTRCEAMPDDRCLGRYGFAIERSGGFVVGPSPRGNLVRGRIAGDELQRLGRLVDRVASTLAAVPRRCAPGGIPGVGGQLEIGFADGTSAMVYDAGRPIGTICYAGNWEDVSSLRDEAGSLLTRYYPSPFP